MRLLILLSALVACGLAAPEAAMAQAGPPPLRVKVLLASSPHLDAAARARHDAMLQSLSAGGPSGGWFEILPTGLDLAEFEHCTISAQDTRTCASRQLAEQGATGATIVVLAGGEGERASWICVGTGARPTSPERQAIRFDLNAGLDTASPKRMETRAAAAGCITSAGAESGW
ncbi:MULTISPECIES: hypothetical protein [unclassified Brevundimonas]|uniref:hypothetical protein n=1 Tax=unclassified Brevundimonas TaxID=2622653 RepID=UPI0006FD5508|nr:MULTISPECIES: hypothetical protein [unclassified Brevundimonas]KQY95540.1 hypothetical protein ASD25_16095 [Brevundimonas sp. Root1423]KRA28304.1 hypothetical protein ASD59_00235 [Brevundimonas sp. Root608]